jgi:exopolyphosphatase/guanosine-5'-triphosphate,3'-diphosphate pyrophosphatase
VIANADMPGFSKREQAALAQLVMAQRGKLAKVAAELLRDRVFSAMVLCLRFAVLLSRSRRNIDARLFQLSRLDSGFHLAAEPAWLARHDLTDYELRQEATEWANNGIPVRLTEPGTD